MDYSEESEEESCQEEDEDVDFSTQGRNESGCSLYRPMERLGFLQARPPAPADTSQKFATQVDQAFRGVES